MKIIRLVFAFFVYSIFVQNADAACEQFMTKNADTASAGQQREIDIHSGKDLQELAGTTRESGRLDEQNPDLMAGMGVLPGFFNCLANVYQAAADRKLASEQSPGHSVDTNPLPISSELAKKRLANEAFLASLSKSAKEHSPEPSPPPAPPLQNHPENNANRCIKLNRGDQGNFGYGAEMTNTCAYKVEVTWCVFTKDKSERCQKGFDSMTILDPGAKWPANALEGNQVVDVQLGACKGANGLQDVVTWGPKMRVSCGAYPN